jgi:hypothetical protein
MRLAIPAPADAFLKQEGLWLELVEAFAFRHFRSSPKDLAIVVLRLFAHKLEET